MIRRLFTFRMDLRYIFLFCLLYYFISPSTLLTDLPGMPIMCLEQRTYEWDMRAAVKCGTQELYHCLQHISNTNIFYEFCENFTYISPGNYPVYNPTSNAIHEKPCPNNTYQNTLLKSSDLNSCLVKTDCTGIGSLVCSNGSPSEDRRCKCDIMKGMVILSYGNKPGNTDICCPYEDPACMCWSKHCQRDRELNEVYQCVPKCKPGFHRPNWTSECISGSSNSNTTIGTIPLSSQTSTKDNVGNTDLGTTTSIPGMDMSMMMSIITMEAIFGVLIIIVVLLVFKFFYQHKNRRKKRNNTTNVDSTTEQHVELPQTNHGDINIEGNTVINIAGDHKGDIYKITDTKNAAIGKGATIVVTEGPNMDEETNLKNDQRRLSSHEDFSETGVKYVTSDSDEETVLLKISPNTSNTEPKYISSHPESLETDIKHVASDSEY